MIPFKNPKTNELRRVKLGFSWTIFLWAGVLGIPLFMRKLTGWGVLMAILGILSTALLLVMPFIAVGAFFLQLYLAFKGNKLTAINLLEQGWEFYEPTSEFTKMAKQQWQLIG
jgi:uncharacterized membrane protein